MAWFECWLGDRLDARYEFEEDAMEWERRHESCPDAHCIPYGQDWYYECYIGNRWYARFRYEEDAMEWLRRHESCPDAEYRMEGVFYN